MSKNPEKRRGLGRGLSALMADVAETETLTSQGPESAERHLPIENIEPNPDQPRRVFDSDELASLADSIRAKGVIQPLIVRSKGNGKYEIVAGERRWRAAQQAQLHELPVVVREFDDTEVLEVAIIENIQRSDLNPIEEAAGYRQLMDRFGHTQEKMAEALGKSRSHIANLLRLLTLPEALHGMLSDGRLSSGHARALVTAQDPIKIANKIVREGLSVRATEALVRKEQASEGLDRKAKGSNRTIEKDADTIALERDLSAALGLKVSLNHKAGGEAGQLVLNYKSLDQLDDLCRRLSGD